MMFRVAIAAVLLLAAAGSAALAQAPQGLSQRYLACEARAKGNTVQSGMCGQAEMAAQDARLNKAYQEVMHQLDSNPAKKTSLRDEQRSWLKKRDYECKIDKETIDDDCIVTRTATRANELEKMIRF